MNEKPAYLMILVEADRHTLLIDFAPHDKAISGYEVIEFEDEDAAREFAFGYARAHLVHGGDLRIVDDKFFRMDLVPTAASAAAHRAQQDRAIKMNPLPGTLPMPPSRHMH